MGLIKTLGRRAWRKFVLDGVSASGFNKPDQDEIFSFVDLIDSDIGNFKKPLFIVASGQSNFARISPATAVPVPDNLFVWNNYDLSLAQPAFLTTAGNAFAKLPNGYGGAALDFAAAAARDNPTRPVYLVVVARGGTPIANWIGGASPDLYAALGANVVAALTAAGLSSIDVFLWWQGEQDASAPSNYFADFQELVTQRLQVETWFPTTTPIVVFGIVGSAVNSNPIYESFAQYLQKCVNHDPDFRMYINTRRLPVSMWADELHASGNGYRFLGRQAWQAFSKGVGQLPMLEQGTFVPTLTFGGAAVGMTYGAVLGAYTRIGRRYFVDISMTLTAKGTSVGAAEINGLPGNAIAAPNRSVNIGRFIGFNGLAGVPQGFAVSNKIQLFESGAASSAVLSDAKFTNTTTIQLSVNYDTN